MKKCYEDLDWKFVPREELLLVRKEAFKEDSESALLIPESVKHSKLTEQNRGVIISCGRDTEDFSQGDLVIFGKYAPIAPFVQEGVFDIVIVHKSDIFGKLVNKEGNGLSSDLQGRNRD